MTTKEMLSFVEKAYNEGNLPECDYKKYKEEFKEISAKEMFEKLGYKLYEHKTYMFYEKALKENPEYENDYEHIEFNFVSETINKTYGDDNSVSDITLEELQAINKQVEELGWDEKNM